MAKCYSGTLGALSFPTFVLQVRKTPKKRHPGRGALKDFSIILTVARVSWKDMHICIWGWRVIGISGSLIWSKTLMGLIFKPYGEFRWSPVSQIHSHHILVGAPGIFTDLLRSVQMIKRESGVRKETGSYPIYSIPGKTEALVPELAVGDLSLAELQPRFLRLQ